MFEVPPSLYEILDSGKANGDSPRRSNTKVNLPPSLTVGVDELGPTKSQRVEAHTVLFSFKKNVLPL